MFCANCGRKLDDGEVCNCVNDRLEPGEGIYNTEVTEESVVTESVSQIKTDVNKPRKKSLIIAMLVNLWGLFIAVIKNPVSAGKSFLKARDDKMAYLIFALHAVSVVIYALVTGVRKVTERTVIYFVAMDTVSSGTGEVIRGIIISLLITALFTFGIACTIYVFSKAFNGKTTYKSMLCLSGLGSLIVIPFIILATVLSFVINTYIIFAVALLLSALVSFSCFDAVCEINENRKVYTVFSAYALLIVVIRVILMIISFVSVY